MPTIDIKEVDISPLGTADVTTNAVYVPGYALIGPVGVPTLCETLTQFREIFGSAPYIFKENGNIDSTLEGVVGFNYSWKAGSPEPSYLYASELLNLGLPVIYERVETGTEYTASTDDFSPVISAIEPGIAGELIYFTLTSSTLEYPEGSDHVYYILSVGRDAGSGATQGVPAVSPVKTFFTFDSDLPAVDSKFKLVSINDTFTDNSGLVSVTVSDVTQETSTKTNLVISGSTSEEEFTPADLYNYLNNNKLSRFEDRNDYVFKYITSGGYPSFGANGHLIATNLLNVAVSRKDITALLDYEVGMDASATAPASIQTYLNTWFSSESYSGGEDVGNYAATFVPWGVHTIKTFGEREVEMVPSFSYLKALANSTQTYANWYAVAGVTRGFIPNIVSTSYNISDTVGDNLQPTDAVAINPIQLIRPYGYRIWGSRTLRDNARNSDLRPDLVATSFLNIRQLANDVKRVVYLAGKQCQFEPDDSVLWINYKSAITPLLDQMKGNRGLNAYEIKRVKSDKKATLKAVIKLYCIDPVENFDITLELTDGEITVAE